MARRKIFLHIAREFQGTLGRVWLRGVVKLALEREGVNPPVEVGVVITGDDTIRALNRAYRDQDETTDVLSFGTQSKQKFTLPPNSPPHLGEIYISYPQAARQADEGDRSLSREVAQLLVHGVLHLLGYDHDEESSDMSDREARILEEVAFNHDL